MKDVGSIILGAELFTGNTFQDISPLSEKEIALIHEADNALIHKALTTANIHKKKIIGHINQRNKEILHSLYEWCDLFVYNGELTNKGNELATLINIEVGKPLTEARIEILDTIYQAKWIIQFAKQIKTEKIEIDKKLWSNRANYSIYYPHGMVLCIKPWNYPFQLPSWTVITSLVTGNIVVFKPSEHASLVGKVIVQSLLECDIDPKLLYFIVGVGNVGSSILEREKVDFVSFSGSLITGKSIKEKALKKNIPVNLELGGNDSMIILEDCNVDLASNAILWGSFNNAGQVCTASKRILIQKKIFNDVIEQVILKGKELRYSIEISPLISSNALNTINSFLEDAIKKGADDIKLIAAEIPPKGYYFPPTILLNVNKSMKIWQDEAFGPIVPIISFGEIEEAIELANDTQYGLGNSIWTEDIDKAKNIFLSLNSGMVWINDINLVFPQSPWHGWNESGQGFELGARGILSYLRVKHVSVNKGMEKNRDWWFPY